MVDLQRLIASNGIAFVARCKVSLEIAI